MSYLEHFKLNEQPFGFTPDPKFIYWSKQHSHAMAYLQSTICWPMALWSLPVKSGRERPHCCSRFWAKSKTTSFTR